MDDTPYHKGQQAEDKASAYLRRRGYQILARNARAGRGELDIVALHGDILVMVEVKAHRQRQRSIEALTEDKQKRLFSAAQAWLARHKQYTPLQCRFDLIILTPTSGIFARNKIEHIKDAFRPE